MTTQYKQLYRSRDNRMIAGVCAGLGKYLGLDPTVVRLLFVLGLLFGHGFVLLAYLVMFMVVPEEPLAIQPGPELSDQPAKPE